MIDCDFQVKRIIASASRDIGLRTWMAGLLVDQSGSGRPQPAVDGGFKAYNRAPSSVSD